MAVGVKRRGQALASTVLSLYRLRVVAAADTQHMPRTIDSFSPRLGVHMDEHAVRRLPWLYGSSRHTGNRGAILSDVEGNGLA